MTNHITQGISTLWSLWSKDSGSLFETPGLWLFIFALLSSLLLSHIRAPGHIIHHKTDIANLSFLILRNAILKFSREGYYDNNWTYFIPLTIVMLQYVSWFQSNAIFLSWFPSNAINLVSYTMERSYFILIQDYCTFKITYRLLTNIENYSKNLIKLQHSWMTHTDTRLQYIVMNPKRQMS